MALGIIETSANKIAAGNAGWRFQFRFAVHVLWSRVPELDVRPLHTPMSHFHRNCLIVMAVLSLLAGCKISPHGGPMFIWTDPSPPPPKPKVSGGNASSYEKAVVIKHSPTPSYTAGLEEIWLQKRKVDLGEGTNLSRVSERLGGRVYDVVSVTSKSGETRLFYFDVSRSNYER